MNCSSARMKGDPSAGVSARPEAGTGAIMRFGLVITDERLGETAAELLASAQERGWECRCFLTDRGALLLSAPWFTDSAGFLAAEVAVCELSIERYEDQGLRVAAIDPKVVIGGQYQDAELVRKSDCVLVL